MTDVGRLSEALVAAQQEMPRLVKNEQAEVVAKSGAKYKYGYLSLQALLEQVLPVLNRHGLALIQTPAYWEGADLLWTHLRHVSGDEVKAAMRVPAGPDATPQQYGSALTYARRYAVLAFLGLAPDEDDDGVKASGAAGTVRGSRVETSTAAPGEPSGPPRTHTRESPPEDVEGAAGRTTSASQRPAAPETLRILKETVETLQKGFPSPDPDHSYWDDVRAYMIGQFAKANSAELTEAQVQELILHFEKRLVEAGKADDVPFG